VGRSGAAEEVRTKRQKLRQRERGRAVDSRDIVVFDSNKWENRLSPAFRPNREVEAICTSLTGDKLLPCGRQALETAKDKVGTQFLAGGKAKK